MNDAEDLRVSSRNRWEKAASGWEAQRESFQRVAHPVSVWLVEHVAPQPGHRVLEVAAGLGDTGLLAAELVQPGGTVILTDGAEAMVEAARRHAEARGTRNVEVRQLEAEWLDLPTASVDAILSRWGYMLLVDPAAALTEARRVLRPGGRIALAAWTQAADNPWLTTLQQEALDQGLIEPSAPDEPGPFAFASPGRIEALLEDAGFEDPVVESLDLRFRYASPAEYAERQTMMSGALTE